MHWTINSQKPYKLTKIKEEKELNALNADTKEYSHYLCFRTQFNSSKRDEPSQIRKRASKQGKGDRSRELKQFETGFATEFVSIEPKKHWYRVTKELEIILPSNRIFNLEKKERIKWSSSSSISLSTDIKWHTRKNHLNGSNKWNWQKNSL